MKRCYIEMKDDNAPSFLHFLLLSFAVDVCVHTVHGAIKEKAHRKT